MRWWTAAACSMFGCGPDYETDHIEISTDHFGELCEGDLVTLESFHQDRMGRADRA